MQLLGKVAGLSAKVAVVVAVFVTAGCLAGGITHAEPVVTGFSADSQLERGQVVALSKTDTTKVELASADELNRIYGVVIDPNDVPITFNRGGQKVFVATSGDYQVLVSTENGTIKADDYLSMSSVKGIAAKATNSHQYIVAKARQAFDGRTNIITTTDNGANIGRIVAGLSPGKNPLLSGNSVPAILQRVSNAVAGKDVPAVRIYASLAVLILTAALVFSLLYTSVRGGMIAIGRNPLGRPVIIRGMLQALLVSLAIFVIGIFGVYLLLKV